MTRRPVTWTRQVLSIAFVNLRRVLVDRPAIGYLLVLPLLVTILVGAGTASAGRQRIGVTVTDASGASNHVAAALRASSSLDVAIYDDAVALRRAVRVGDVTAGVEVSGSGSSGLQFVSDRSRPYPLTARLAVEAAVGATHGTGRPSAVFASVGGRGDGTYGHASRGDLLLFVFLSTVSGAGGVVATRRLGIHRRVAVGPVSPTQIATGEVGGRLLIAGLQAVLILVASRVAFGIEWGSPLAVAATILVFATLSAAVAVALGSVARSESQGMALGVVIGLAAAMLGGCLWSLSLVGGALARIGALVPHAWAMTALERSADGQFPLRELLYLLAATIGALAVAARGMRREDRLTPM